jgi:hypothetical protein
MAAFAPAFPPVPVEGEQSLTMISSGKQEKMKRIASMALILNLGVAAVYAVERPVKMTFSGTSASTAVDLQQPNTSNDEDNFSGTGTLGSFTFRAVRAISNLPAQSSTCSGANQFYSTEPAAEGVFRFADGSLLKVNLVQGGDCIDFAAQQAHCTLTFQITGGTGRFRSASGALTFTETSTPVLATSLVFFAASGEFTGTVSGVGAQQSEAEGQ